MLFLYLSIVVLNAIAYFIPKKMSRLELYITTIFAYSLQWIADVILDLKYDLYGYFNKGGFDWASLLAVYGIYPAISVIYLNGFPYHAGYSRQGLYIAGWTLFSLVYEWCALHSGWFYYNGWKLWYSAVIDPCLFLVLLWHFKIIRKMYKSELRAD